MEAEQTKLPAREIRALNTQSTTSMTPNIFLNKSKLNALEGGASTIQSRSPIMQTKGTGISSTSILSTSGASRLMRPTGNKLPELSSPPHMGSPLANVGKKAAAVEAYGSMSSFNGDGIGSQADTAKES